MNTDISRKDAALRTCEFAARVSGIKLTVTKNYETNLSKVYTFLTSHKTHRNICFIDVTMLLDLKFLVRN